MKLFNEILGTRYPIIQGGMANIATGEFAAACSNAGALGIIGAGGMNADTLRENIRRCKQLTAKPFGVNIMLMHPQADEFAKIVVEEGVQVVTTGAGNPGKYVPMWKAAGIKVIPVVAAAVLAKHLEPLGIDAVIAEGTESGGHVGEMTTMALVPQVVDAVSVPVIAAGGIADGRQLADRFFLFLRLLLLTEKAGRDILKAMKNVERTPSVIAARCRLPLRGRLWRCGEVLGAPFGRAVTAGD